MYSPKPQNPMKKYILILVNNYLKLEKPINY